MLFHSCFPFYQNAKNSESIKLYKKYKLYWNIDTEYVKLLNNNK